MPDPLRITLSYHGPSADDGTMAVSDLLSALQGFSGAYGKIASRLTSDTEHHLRVSAVERNSFEVLLLSIAFLGVQPNQQQLIELAVDAGKRVVSVLLRMVEAKKHVKGKPYSVNIEGSSNTVVLVNADNAKLDIPRELLEILQNKTVDADFSRIASPLRRNEIESAKITADGIAGKIIAEIAEVDKGYFESVSIETIATSKDVQVEGYCGRFRPMDRLAVAGERLGRPVGTSA